MVQRMMQNRSLLRAFSSRVGASASGLAVAALCVLATPTAQAQVLQDANGKPFVPPPPLPPPAGQPVPRPASVVIQPMQPVSPPPVMPADVLPGSSMCADVHTEMQQLLSALLEHRRTAETVAIRQRNRSLIAGGATLFASGYLAAVIAGSVYLQSSQGSSFARDVSTERSASGTLMIPVVGPLVSSLIWRDPIWAINWSLVDGVAQMGGVAMMVVGIVSNRRLPAPLVGLQLAPVRTSTQTGLTLSGSF